LAIVYLTRSSSQRICAQEFEYSCGAACARQLLVDTGHLVTEEDVRSRARFDPEAGIWAVHLAEALALLHGEPYEGGIPDIDPPQWPRLLRSGPTIVMLERHWVIVDGVTQDNVVLVRDPAPLNPGGKYGCEATLSWADFFGLLRLGKYQVVRRVT
jgi:hypothetical protein